MASTYANVLIRPTLDKQPYRLRCRFKIEPRPSRERIDREKVRVAEMFIADMKKQGWVYDTRFGFEITGPFVPLVPQTIRIPRTPTAREMAYAVSQGARFLDDGRTPGVMLSSGLGASEWWEYEISTVFIRTQILTEQPDAHEVTL